MNKHTYKIIKLLYQGPFALGKFPVARYHIVNYFLDVTYHWNWSDSMDIWWVNICPTKNIFEDNFWPRYFSLHHQIYFSMPFHMKTRDPWCDVSNGHCFSLLWSPWQATLKSQKPLPRHYQKHSKWGCLGGTVG